MPIDVRTEAGRVRLLSYVWPDQRERLARLKGAIELFRRFPVAIDEAMAAEWLAAVLAERRRGQLTVIWRSVMRPHMTHAESAELERVIAAAGERATAENPLALIELESAGSVAAGMLLMLRRWPEGTSQVLGRRPWHGGQVAWEAPQ